MSRKMNVLVAVTSILFSILLISFQVGASDLDPRFVDADGDLVADAPTDPRQWIDPAVLLFSYTPVEDPAVYRDAWADFTAYLAQETGKRVQFYPVHNYAAQLEALRSGRLHVAGVNTGSVPFAVNVAGFVPFAIMAAEDGSFGYEMEVIVHVDSDIKTLEDLRGRQLALVSPTSNSGFKAPTALLEAEFGMVPDIDYRTAFSGRHDNSILGVFNKDYDAAAIANTVMVRIAGQGIIDPAQIRTIYTSQTFPTTAYGHVHNLHPELAARIRNAFYSFDWTGTGLEEVFGRLSGDDRSQFIPITYKEHWEVIRTIDRISGVEYR